MKNRCKVIFMVDVEAPTKEIGKNALTEHLKKQLRLVPADDSHPLMGDLKLTPVIVQGEGSTEGVLDFDVKITEPNKGRKKKEAPTGDTEAVKTAPEGGSGGEGGGETKTGGGK